MLPASLERKMRVLWISGTAAMFKATKLPDRPKFGRLRDAGCGYGSVKVQIISSNNDWTWNRPLTASVTRHRNKHEFIHRVLLVSSILCFYGNWGRNTRDVMKLPVCPQQIRILEARSFTVSCSYYSCRSNSVFPRYFTQISLQVGPKQAALLWKQLVSETKRNPRAQMMRCIALFISLVRGGGSSGSLPGQIGYVTDEARGGIWRLTLNPSLFLSSPFWKSWFSKHTWGSLTQRCVLIRAVPARFCVTLAGEGHTQLELQLLPDVNQAGAAPRLPPPSSVFSVPAQRHINSIKQRNSEGLLRNWRVPAAAPTW